MTWILLLVGVLALTNIAGARFGRGSNPQTVPALVAVAIATFFEAPALAWWALFMVFAFIWFASGDLREPPPRQLHLIIRQNPVIQGPYRWALGAIGAVLLVIRLAKNV